MNRKKLKIFPLSILIAAVLILLAAGYWVYQKSVRSVINATTVSFIEQIAEHDRQNMINQMDSKWEALATITNRVDVAREYTLDEALTDLKLNVGSGTFQRLYLVTDRGIVYSHTALKTKLEDAAWNEAYLNSEGSFATIYRESSREHWGEYMVCGARLEQAVQCDGETIVGIVGMVPISTIANQLRLESFDQMGMTVIIESNGDIITSSKVYDSSVSNNYLNFLESTKQQEGYDKESIQAAIKKGEQLLLRFSAEGEGFYTLISPLGDEYYSGWNLVVQMSDKITNNQVQRLLIQSLVFFVLIGFIFLAVAVFIYGQMAEVKPFVLLSRRRLTSWPT